VSAERWTLCGGCFMPVDVTEIPADVEAGASWHYACPACEWEASADDVFADLDQTKDAPPPPDPLVMLAAIVGAVVERAGREAVGVALGFIAAPPAPEPADPNQLPLPLGATS